MLPAWPLIFTRYSTSDLSEFIDKDLLDCYYLYTIDKHENILNAVEDTGMKTQFTRREFTILKAAIR